VGELWRKKMQKWEGTVGFEKALNDMKVKEDKQLSSACC
jgi:hypothetical protein